MKELWYWLNATFGVRKYFRKDRVIFIKEGFNKPEEFKEHLKNYHYDEYIEYVGRRRKG